MKPPCAIIFQLEHSKLGGRIAEALRDELLGELPPEVIQAIAQHDFGWMESDEEQVRSLGKANPRPFSSLSAEETLPSWNRSVAHAKELDLLTYVLVSRHFTTLGAGESEKADFVRVENARRDEIERSLPSAVDLDGWTGAIGFCDLVSLYLCCGSQHPVEFPLAHPADARSSSAPKVNLTWTDGIPHFAPSVLGPGTHLSLEAAAYSGYGNGLTPLRLEWHFPAG